MQFYNRIMLYFWLIMAIAIFFFISYMSYTEGIKKWGYYYIFVVTSIAMFFFKKWMMNRMEKHLAFLEEQKAKEKK
jgi:hypothetical protein